MNPSDELILDLKKTIREKIGPLATPDFIHITSGLQKLDQEKL